jgi:hypothetical protein
MATRDGTRGSDNRNIPNHGTLGFSPAETPIARVSAPESSTPLRQRRVCSWCGEVLFAGDPGTETTHDICLACDTRVRAAEGLPPSKEAIEADLEAVQRFRSDDCVAFLRGLGLEPLPGAVGV